MDIFLSYILTTYNKLNYLRHTLPPLLAALEDDDELIIVDGGSIDGSADYIRTEVNRRKGVTILSEKDRGEAHGFNKGLMLAKGTYIKVITDDDLYHYAEIKKIKGYLRTNQECDAMLTGVLETNPVHFPKHWLLSNEEHKFRNYLCKQKACDFIGIPLFIRRASLPLLGLFNTSIKCVDSEFTLRFAKLRAKVLFYTGVTAFRLENPDSVYYNLSGGQIEQERQRINYLWNDEYYKAQNKGWSLLKKSARAFLKGGRVKAAGPVRMPLELAYDRCAALLEAYDNSKAEYLKNWN